MRLVLLFLLGLLLGTADVFGQDDQAADARDFAAQAKARMANQQLTSLLSVLVSSPTLQTELGVDAVQLGEIRENTKAYQTKMIAFHNEHREEQQVILKLYQDGDHELARSMSAAYQKKLSELVAELSEMANVLLLPDQMKRLKQIMKQQYASRRNPFGDEFGMVLALADELKLTVEEAAELNQVIQKTRSDYYEKVDELRELANQRILKSLPAEKRKLLEEAIGELYDPAAQTRADADERRKKSELERKQRMEQYEKAKQRLEKQKAQAAEAEKD